MPDTVTQKSPVYFESTTAVRTIKDLPYGTAAEQEPNAVAFTGGTIDGVPLTIEADVAAAGADETDATVLNGSDITVVDTIAAGAGVIFPVAVVGQERFIYNNHASEALDIYPFAGGSIDGGSANAPLIIAADVGVTLHAVTTTLWLSDA